MDNETLVKGIVDALDDKKAENVKVLDISDISDIADHFILATAGNPNQMDAMKDAVDEYMTRSGINARNIEGKVRENSNWILMDYEDIIVHIFDPEAREFYDLEHIWRGGRKSAPASDL